MGYANRSADAAKKTHNRVAAIRAHTRRYAFRGTSRLAADAGVSKSTISHLVHGKTNPLYNTVDRVVKCLEAQLGQTIDFRDVVSHDGCYASRFMCEALACPGCLPDVAFEVDGTRRLGFEAVQPGCWTGDVWEFNGL